MGDIGPNKREYIIEPLREDEPAMPERVPTPAPAPVTVPEKEPVGV